MPDRFPTPAQKTATFKRLDYDPFPAQARIHASRATVLQIVGAEGGGKSFVTAMEVTACVPWSSLVYLVGQTYDNSHREFEYLVQSLTMLGALAEPTSASPARVAGK